MWSTRIIGRWRNSTAAWPTWKAPSVPRFQEKPWRQAMRRSETRWLMAGIGVGVLVAVTIFTGRQYLMRQSEPTPVAADSTPVPTGTPDQAAAPNPDSGASVELTDEEQKSIGVETVVVQRQTLRKKISAPGRVAEPETGIGAISARVSGRIDKLLLNITGESVTRGQPVALIYSPEVFTAGEEY